MTARDPEQPKATLPDLIEVEATRDGYSLRIDGQEFPWFITSDGVSTSVPDKAVPAVTVTILAKRLTVRHELEPEIAKPADEPDPKFKPWE